MRALGVRHNGRVYERILVVEDDADLRANVSASLTDAGFETSVAATGARALSLACASPSPDLIILDIGLPDSDGRDVCQAIKAQGVSAPVIFLTARDAVTDRVSGFGAGGDDYLIKPFAFAELRARVESLLRRSGDNASDPGMRLDPLAHGISLGDRRIDLTPTEFRLLATLVARPGEAVRRRALILAAWPEGAIVSDNTLDVYVSRLRRKLAELRSSDTISTVHGVGYRWK